MYVCIAAIVAYIKNKPTWPELLTLATSLLPMLAPVSRYFHILTGHWWNLWLRVTEPSSSVETRSETTAAEISRSMKEISRYLVSLWLHIGPCCGVM